LFLFPISPAVTPPQRSFAPAAKPPQCVCCRNMVRISAAEKLMLLLQRPN
jgi:hypothetical protein